MASRAKSVRHAHTRPPQAPRMFVSRFVRQYITVKADTRAGHATERLSRRVHTTACQIDYSPSFYYCILYFQPPARAPPLVAKSRLPTPPPPLQYLQRLCAVRGFWHRQLRQISRTRALTLSSRNIYRTTFTNIIVAIHPICWCVEYRGVMGNPVQICRKQIPPSP